MNKGEGRKAKGGQDTPICGFFCYLTLAIYLAQNEALKNLRHLGQILVHVHTQTAPPLDEWLEIDAELPTLRPCDGSKCNINVRDP